MNARIGSVMILEFRVRQSRAVFDGPVEVEWLAWVIFRGATFLAVRQMHRPMAQLSLAYRDLLQARSPFAGRAEEE